MNKDGLLKLRSMLKRGDRRLIAEKTGKHVSAVDQVLRGEFQNAEIIEAAVEIAEDNQKVSKNLESRIQSL